MREKKGKSSKENQAEQGLLPYPVILAAQKGEPEAIEIVLQHYDRYIRELSKRKFRDEQGNVYYGVDKDIHDRLQAKLIRAVLSFQI